MRVKHQRKKAKFIIDFDFQVKSVKVDCKYYSALTYDSIIETEGKKIRPYEYVLMDDYVTEVEVITILEEMISKVKENFKTAGDKREVKVNYTCVFH